jgi:hypothetical protein
VTILDWLKRLGILRYGAEKAVYRNAAERPTSFMMDGVFDSKKDAIDLNKKSELPVDAVCKHKD